MNATRALPALIASIVMFGCSRPDAEGPRTPAAPPEQEQTVTQAISDNEGWTLAIRQEVAGICPGAETPKPSPDTAWVRAQWRDSLKSLAECMNSGALVGDDLVLVGHGGRRTWNTYGMATGKSKAEQLRDALVALGVDENRITITSHKSKHVHEGEGPLERPSDARIEVCAHFNNAK